MSLNLSYRTIFSIFACHLMLTAAAVGQVTFGEVELEESRFGPPEGAPTIELGETVNLAGSLYISEFFGAKVINGHAVVTNTGEQPMYYAYHLAVFDADGNLIGAAGMKSFGDDGLAAGEEIQLGGMMISVPEDKLADVATYQAAFYESAEPF